MKTIKEWLETLPEPYRTEAIENATNEGSIRFRTKHKSLSEALGSAFTWYFTLQGHDYWVDLYDKLEKNNQ